MFFICIFIEQRQKYTHLKRKSDRMLLSGISHYQNNYALKHFKLLETLLRHNSLIIAPEIVFLLQILHFLVDLKFLHNILVE